MSTVVNVIHLCKKKNQSNAGQLKGDPVMAGQILRGQVQVC